MQIFRAGQRVHMLDSQRNPIVQPAVVDAPCLPGDSEVRLRLIVSDEAIAQGQTPGEQRVTVPLSMVFAERQMNDLHVYMMEIHIPF
jgi:hypothetical protein